MNRKRALLIGAPLVFLVVLVVAGLRAAPFLTRIPIYPGSRFVSNSGWQFQTSSQCVACRLGSVSIGTASLYETADNDMQIDQWCRRNGWNVMDVDPVYADWTLLDIAGHRLSARAWVRNLYNGELEASYGVLLWW